MSTGIKQIVGRKDLGAVNDAADVQRVRQLLEFAAGILNDDKLHPRSKGGGINDDWMKSGTIRAMMAFQERCGRKPMGVFYPLGKSIKYLLRIERTGGPNFGDGPYFPFSFSMQAKYPWDQKKGGMRRFAANRGEHRAHAGCDLYAAHGRAIYAVAAGRVLYDPIGFYNSTCEFAIDHGDFVVRYGEIQSKAFVKVNQWVEAGQKIARVGHLVPTVTESDMLHFETYDRGSRPPFSVGASISKRREDGRPFLRKKTLLNPTDKLEAWVKNLPIRY